MKNKFIYYYLAIIVILALSAYNIHVFTTPNQVLGITNEVNNEETFWNNFLKVHPNYIPGLIEIGELNKVKQINPNYEINK